MVEFAKENAPIYFVDPYPSISPSKRITVFADSASVGVPKVVSLLNKWI